MEAGLSHPQRERSGARVRRQRRDDAQGARSDGGRASAHAAAGPRHVRQRPSPRTSSPRASAISAASDGSRVCGRGQVGGDRRGHGQRAGARAAAACSPGDGVYRIHRVRHHKGQVFLVEDASLPAALFPGLAEKKRRHRSHHRAGPGVRHCCWARRRSASRSAGPRRRWRKRSASPPDSPVMVLDRVVHGSRRSADRMADGLLPLADRYYMAEMV